MKISFTPFDGDIIQLPNDAGRGDCVAVPGWLCLCGNDKVHGVGREIESHDTYRAQARCTSCGKEVGVLRAKVSTLFGLAEDERMARSYIKIY